MPREAHTQSVIHRGTARAGSRARRYTSPYRDVMRAKIVLLAAEGLRNDASPHVWTCRARSSASGVSVSIERLPGPRRGAARRATSPLFPPASWSRSRRLLVSCRSRRGLPLARWSVAEIAAGGVADGIVARSAAPRSGAGLARTHCARGAIAAGSFRAIRSSPAKPAASSISTNAGGKVQRLGRAITCSAPTRRPASRQAGANILRCPRGPGRPIYVEHEYDRAGALAYLAAWDVHRAKLFGRCERKNGIAAFDRLVDQVMRQEPYRSARRVFLIADNGSSHRGAESLPTGSAPDGPTSFWSIRRSTPVGSTRSKSTSPSSSANSSRRATSNLADLEGGLLAFQARYQRAAKPFKWTFTRADLHALLARLDQKPLRPAA